MKQMPHKNDANRKRGTQNTGKNDCLTLLSLVFQEVLFVPNVPVFFDSLVLNFSQIGLFTALRAKKARSSIGIAKVSGSKRTAQLTPLYRCNPHWPSTKYARTKVKPDPSGMCHPQTCHPPPTDTPLPHCSKMAVELSWPLSK